LNSIWLIYNTLYTAKKDNTTRTFIS